MATGILMEMNGITAVRTWHVATPTPTRRRRALRYRRPADARAVDAVGRAGGQGSVARGEHRGTSPDSMPIVCYDRGEAMNVRFSDSHSNMFTRDIWTSVCDELWANAAYTRVVPARRGHVVAHEVRRAHHVTSPSAVHA